MQTHFKFLFLCCFILFVACKKTSPSDSGPKHCWQIIDHLGNNLDSICGKTEAELLACSNCGPNGIPVDSCSYYQIDEDTSCWLINNSYHNGLTESQAQLYARCLYHTTATKVNCENCQNYYTRKKMTYKPTGVSTYSTISFNKYCNDSLAIALGGETIIKNTADSLIVLQFSLDGRSFR